MKLNRIKLVNACLHDVTDVSFGPGLTGVFGPQGSGKSTMLDLGFAALTNNFDRIQGGKEGAVRQQAQKGDLSQIELWAEHHDTPFHLLRRLRPSVSNRLTIGENDPLKKSPEIQAALEGLLGVDRQMLDRYVFVEQWALRALFQQGPADRAKMLAHLCNTEHAEFCWKLTGEQLELDAGLVAEVVDNTDELRQKIGEHDAVLADYAQRQTCCEGKLLSDAYVAELQAAVARRHRRDHLTGEIEKLLADEHAKFALAKAAIATFKQRAAELDAANQTALDAEAKDRTVQADALHYSERWRAWNNREKLVSDIAATRTNVAKPAPKLPEMLMDYEQMKERREELEEAISPYKQLLRVTAEVDGCQTCPTCGQSIVDIEQNRSQAQRSLATLEPKHAKLCQDMAKWEGYLNQVQLYESRVTSSEAELARQLARLAEMGEVVDPGPAPFTKADLQASLDAKIKAAQAKTAAKTAVDKAQQDKANKIAAHKAAKAQREQAEQELDSLADVQDTTESEQQLAENQRSREQLAAIKAVMEERARAVAEAREQIAQVERVKARSVKAKHWVNVLGPSRQALHRDALPREAHLFALRRMEAGVNDMLKLFESPFYVTTSEELSYDAHFANGTVMPAKGLSGGQQVVLAIAFRWVLNSLFASQIGMMVLDEPTAGLDRRHVDLLEAALRGLGAAARSRGCQVIIVTHEASLEAVFDQSVHLEKANL